MQHGPEEARIQGHPKGTTKIEAHQKKTREKNCLDAIASVYTQQKEDSNNNGTRLTKGWVNKIIDAKKKEFNVPDLCVSYLTIHNQMKQNNTKPPH